MHFFQISFTVEEITVLCAIYIFEMFTILMFSLAAASFIDMFTYFLECCYMENWPFKKVRK